MQKFYETTSNKKANNLTCILAKLTKGKFLLMTLMLDCTDLLWVMCLE